MRGIFVALALVAVTAASCCHSKKASETPETPSRRARAPNPAPPPPNSGATAAAAAAPPIESCEEDSDCTLTRMELEGCCETLCRPRAVTYREEKLLAQRRSQCDQMCPAPACAPFRWSFAATCVAGKCELSVVDDR